MKTITIFTKEDLLTFSEKVVKKFFNTFKKVSGIDDINKCTLEDLSKFYELSKKDFSITSLKGEIEQEKDRCINKISEHEKYIADYREKISLANQALSKLDSNKSLFENIKMLISEEKTETKKKK